MLRMHRQDSRRRCGRSSRNAERRAGGCWLRRSVKRHKQPISFRFARVRLVPEGDILGSSNDTAICHIAMPLGGNRPKTGHWGTKVYFLADDGSPCVRCQASGAETRDRGGAARSRPITIRYRSFGPINCKGAPVGAPPEIGRFRLSFVVVIPVEPAVPIAGVILPLWQVPSTALSRTAI